MNVNDDVPTIDMGGIGRMPDGSRHVVDPAAARRVRQDDAQRREQENTASIEAIQAAFVRLLERLDGDPAVTATDLKESIAPLLRDSGQRL